MIAISITLSAIVLVIVSAGWLITQAVYASAQNLSAVIQRPAI